MSTKFVRKANTIKNIETGNVEVFSSINKAKRESRRIQLANGGLGRGSLVAVKG